MNPYSPLSMVVSLGQLVVSGGAARKPPGRRLLRQRGLQSGRQRGGSLAGEAGGAAKVWG